jgi:imidazoleglycerol phosphate dehydratase HisB
MRKSEANAQFRGCIASASLDLDGSGKAKINSGSGFLDHMLNALARTALLDLTAKAEPGFFKTEALGAAIGQALDNVLADRSGIARYGSASVPMDEALADVALDFSGRPYLIFSGKFMGERIGDFEVQQIKPFLEAMTDKGRLTLHVRFYGENDHHMAESIFKALGLAIARAVAKKGKSVPSTKGVI